MANHLGQAVRIPDYMADATLNYYADIFRNVLDHLGTPGRRDSKSLVVQPYSGGGMRIQVTAGTAMISGTDRGAADSSGITLQGSYIARVDALIGPVTIAAAPTSGTRTDNVYLVVSDKAENGSGTNDAYVAVLASTATTPKSALRLASIDVAPGTSAITSGMISPGPRAAGPALVDSNYGYVDKFTADTDPGSPIAAKRFDKLAIGSASRMGTNIFGMTILDSGFHLDNQAWTDIPFHNADPANGIDYIAATMHDDGWLYSNPTGPLNGWVPNSRGWYRVSGCFGFGGSGDALTRGNRGLRAITEGGRILACAIHDASEVADNSPITISQPFYWPFANDESNPIKLQIYQGSGGGMTIPNPDHQHPQVAVLEMIALS
jgi:hypothetical protein